MFFLCSWLTAFCLLLHLQKKYVVYFDLDPDLDSQIDFMWEINLGIFLI
jgi:hypothetical protein